MVALNQNKMKKIKLPKQYEYIEGITNPKYKQYDGWEKVSYSQINSFESPEYKGQYIASYFAGIPDPGNVFSTFGSMCGNYLDTSNQVQDPYLDEEDLKALDEVIRSHPKDSIFEYEIVISLEPFGLERTCLQAFVDRLSIEEGVTSVVDFKTGGENKIAYYTSDDYEQLDIYCYGLEQLGFENLVPQVILLSRKGNQLDKSALHSNGKTPMGLRLNGDIFNLPREYNKKRSEEILKRVAKTCIKISDYLKIYKKYLNENND